MVDTKIATEIDDTPQTLEAIVAIMPLFIKSHSYGEYVFDWSWAEAYHRHGIEYYPKLLNGIPFTPATGPRWIINSRYSQDEIITFMQTAITTEAEKINASSCHCIFPFKKDNDSWISTDKNNRWLKRVGYQYHWHNQSYENFEDFLSEMSSRKRKNIKKERLKIQQQNIQVNVKCGNEISPEDWHHFYMFYQLTYIKKSGHGGYLTSDFFPMLAKNMSDNIVMITADVSTEDNINETVAAALYFRDEHTLYGRYWGCKENFDGLHFELCYYQGIEFAITNKLQRFDPGAQGEHKIQRGFTPIKTYSTHWIQNKEFHTAIQKFVVLEEKEVESYIEEAKQLLPFKASAC